MLRLISSFGRFLLGATPFQSHLICVLNNLFHKGSRRGLACLRDGPKYRLCSRGRNANLRLEPAIERSLNSFDLFGSLFLVGRASNYASIPVNLMSQTFSGLFADSWIGESAQHVF